MHTCVAAIVLVTAVTAAAESVRAQAPASRPAWTKVRPGEVQALVVQYAGRTMPVDTLAREIIREITGQRVWGEYNPTVLLLAWTWQGETWKQEPLVVVGDPALQERVGLAKDRKRFCYGELVGNERLAALRRAAEPGAAESAELSSRERAMARSAAEVSERLRLLEAVFEGQVLRVVPPATDAEAAWVTVADAGSQEGIGPAEQEKIRAEWQALRAAFLAGDTAGFRQAGKSLDKTLAGLKSPAWPDKNLMVLEVLYNFARPFRAGWALTLAATAAGLVSLALSGKWVRWVRYAVWGLLIDGAGILTVGLLVRWKCCGHNPVATVNELLILMGWGVVAIGIVTMLVARQKAALPIVAAVATGVLVLADSTLG